MKLLDDAIARIEALLPGATCSRSGMTVRVTVTGATTYVMPESLQGLSDSQAAGLIVGMVYGVRT